MTIPGSGLGRFGRFGLICAGLLALWGLIVHFGGAVGIITLNQRLSALALVSLLLLLLRYLPAIYRNARERLHRRQEKQSGALPEDESRVALTPPRNMTVSEIRQTLRYQYGRAWHRKVRILLVTGNVADVEQLTPKLPRELWQEDQGTLLLWGGDPAMPADTAWFTALRKLRHRPVDGMVWVTSAFDRLSWAEAELPVPLTPESTDTLAHALSHRYDALGWKLPLYVWSLHPRSGVSSGRVTQPVGCLLPAGCTPQTLARQVTVLIPALTTRGIQQICGEPQHHFLLALADQLAREPESLTGPLSVLLNPYRPLPLAGILFSPPSVGAARSIAHHWGKDNRWDILPDRMTELPAGLRPRKPGVSWPQMVGATAVNLSLREWTFSARSVNAFSRPCAR